MLKINGVVKHFGEKTVLSGLSLEVAEHSIFGLVGVNGAGKSTLLRMISGIYQPDGGNVEFDDRDTYTDVAVRKDIFFVSDDPYYPNTANIRTLKEFYKTFYSIDEEIFAKYMQIFKLDENKMINTFSKGMKRQMMLIFGLAIRPKLLLLDEAFDGLDPLVRVHIKKALVDAVENYDTTIIISSHNLKELEDICDSYGILSNGLITTYGDLLESKANINKYQLAFTKPIDESVFAQFDVRHISKEGSVYNLVIKGNKEEVLKKLTWLEPVILDTLNVNFEELFIYEQEGSER